MKTSSFGRRSESDRVARRAGRGSRRRPLVLEALEGRVVMSLTPQMVLDINPACPGLEPRGARGDRLDGLLHAPTTASTAYELWKSDGTAAGTTMVKDITRAAARLGPPATSRTSTGRCSSRPTTASTAGSCGRATAPPPAPPSSRTSTRATAAVITVTMPTVVPSNLTNVNGTLFFAAQDGEHGRELWKSDGTAAGTMLVKDIDPGGGRARPPRT